MSSTEESQGTSESAMADSGVEPGPVIPELVESRVGASLRALRSDLCKYEGCKLCVQVGCEGVQMEEVYAATIYANSDGEGGGSVEVEVELDGRQVEAALADRPYADCAGTKDLAGARNLIAEKEKTKTLHRDQSRKDAPIRKTRSSGPVEVACSADGAQGLVGPRGRSPAGRQRAKGSPSGKNRGADERQRIVGTAAEALARKRGLGKVVVGGLADEEGSGGDSSDVGDDHVLGGSAESGGDVGSKGDDK